MERVAAAPEEPLEARLRGFGPAGLFAILAILGGALLTPWIGATLVILWARFSRTPWSSLGYVRPKSWPRTILAGIAFGALFKLVLKALIMPLLGADPVNRAYHYLAGNTDAIPGTVVAVIVSAGFGEETIYRGYLFERLGKLWGSSLRAKAAIVVLSAALFGLAHWSGQGWWAVVQATIVGLVYGAIFARTRELVPLMIAHVAFDFTALALIFWDLETKVAHFIFK